MNSLQKIILFTTILLFCGLKCEAQSYTVEIIEERYDTLVDYSSIVKENWDDRIIPPNEFEKEINFNFQFPYFNKFYDKINLSNFAFVDFDGCEEFPMLFLVQLSPFYAVLNQPDIYNSDFRYKHDNINGKSVFILEYKNVDVDYDVDTEVDLSFQFWFWENGNIEVKFGDLICPEPYFTPGKGAYDAFSNKYYPLTMSILSCDVEEIINVGGDINTNPIIHYNTNFDDTLGLTHLPLKNTVCRFKKKTSNTEQPFANKLDLPNLVTNEFIIKDEIEFNQYCIKNSLGNNVLNGNSRVIDISNIPAGLYLITLYKGKFSKTVKFVKI